MPHTPAQIQAMDGLLDELGRRSSSSIALVLGAGASRPFGYPLTRELMLNIFHGLGNGELLKLSAAELRGLPAGSLPPAQELHRFLSALLPGDNPSAGRVPMVTGVLSLLDFALSTGQGILPGMSIDATRRARELLETAVIQSIPDWEWFSDDEHVRFKLYCNWLESLLGVRPAGGLALITTNYDMIADIAALKVARVSGNYGNWSHAALGRKVDFGFRWIRPDCEHEETPVPRPENPTLAVYKLHGSTNWLRCPLCENLYINPNGPISWEAFRQQASPANQCHCSETRLEWQIVSPSFVRDMREPNLISVWKNALDFLRQCDHWVMIGYGFPDEDVGVRALFTRAFHSSKVAPRISVVQLGTDAEINYESFFQEGSLKYLTGGLDLLLDRWQARRRNGR